MEVPAVGQEDIGNQVTPHERHQQDVAHRWFREIVPHNTTFS
jgi:hypothetical protein